MSGGAIQFSEYKNPKGHGKFTAALHLFTTIIYNKFRYRGT
jgi:hypothetical protein